VIKSKFSTALNQHPDRPFIVSSTGEWSYADFYKYVGQVASIFDQLGPGRLACHLPDSPELISMIFAAGLSGRSLVLFNHEYIAAQLEPLLKLTEVTFLITDTKGVSFSGCEVLDPKILLANDAGGAVFDREAEADSEILILTSGTTGQPKCALYLWRNLFAQVKSSGLGNNERWLLAYRLNHFAGMQMLVHALSNGSTLVLAESQKVADAIDALVDFQVTHVSSTPTFWRFAMALLQEKQSKLALQHITLGSEAASGDLLEKLHALFPDARIVHIYASTEAGSCISVSDMKPGLPASVLDRPDDSESQFRIVDGELQIKSRYGMSGYLGPDGAQGRASNDQGWRASGDLVRIEDDRIVFEGRKNETINVGGVKVHPLDVENRITPVAGVKLVRAYAKKNAIVGHIVAIDVVCHEGHDPAAVEDEIRAACDELVPAARPRSINFVDTILTNNLKLNRQ
jgi:acyl-CoA synthetase (AMP-forming)/AMP-acid ligase II